MNYKCILTDLDGTIYLDSNPIGEVIFNINNYKSRGGRVFYLTNNTSVNKITYLEKLFNLGIERIDIKDIISPIDVLLDQFKKTGYIKSCYYLLPEEVISFIIKNGGPKFNESNPDAVIVGFDKELTYDKLKKASLFISNNIDYFLTHNDLFCPTENGPIPDAGSIAHLLMKSTNVKYKADFGKPSFHMVQYVRSIIYSIGLNYSDVIMIGDRKKTDIMLGKKIGIKTCLVLTGDKNINKQTIISDYECSDINLFFLNHLYK
jgi:HAD superfamily hydrolase (TIGR01450 family)